MKKKHYFTYFGNVQLSSPSGLMLLIMRLILFGLDQNVQTDRRFDLIILMAKFHIFKSKLQKGKPNVNIFIHSLKQRAVIEKYCIAATDQEERHETQPLSLADLLCLE